MRVTPTGLVYIVACLFALGIPLLGIYPNLQGLTLQVVLVAVILIGFFYLRANSRRM